jgi:hypothetical protein
MGKKAETEKRGEHEDCLTLYPVFPFFPRRPNLQGEGKGNPRKLNNQSERKARVFAMATAHLELLHTSIRNLC